MRGIALAQWMCSLALLSLAACSDDANGTGANDEARGPLGKADAAGSCKVGDGDACGSKSPSHCWCDELCASYGDCCADKVEVCDCDCSTNPTAPECAAVCTPPAVCGDGKIDAGEECDGADVGGESCDSLGFTGGTLGCDPSCKYDASACTNTLECAAWAGGPLSFIEGFSADLVNPQWVRLGDLDADGDLDMLVVTTQGTDTGLQVFANGGAGGFTQVAQFADRWWPQRPRIADLDHDGIADIVGLANHGGLAVNNRLTVRRGLGNFAYAAPVVYTLPSTNTREFELADLDGDGDLDAVIAGMTAVGVRLGTGTGTFGALTSHTMQGSGSAQGVEVLDTDGDGDLDVVAQTASTACTFPGRGDGTLDAAAKTCFSIGTDVRDLAAGQYTDDSFADLAYVRNDGRRFGLALGSGPSTFSSDLHEVDTFSQRAWRLEVGDVDCDGHTDFAAHSFGVFLDTVEIHRIDGTGAMLDPVGQPIPSPVSVDLGDVDGDGADDIVAVSNQTGVNPAHRVVVFVTRQG